MFSLDPDGAARSPPFAYSLAPRNPPLVHATPQPSVTSREAAQRLGARASAGLGPDLSVLLILIALDFVFYKQC